uniref:Uncharacterized protein n=1 Tax=Ciona intestinalis TaxID=7719 RepID=H2XQ77_CIOIN
MVKAPSFGLSLMGNLTNGSILTNSIWTSSPLNGFHFPSIVRSSITMLKTTISVMV